MLVDCRPKLYLGAVTPRDDNPLRFQRHRN
jgi:hypothetical protein